MVLPEPRKVTLSRLEVNFLRVLRETQLMASGARTPNWTLDKLVRCRRLLVLYGSQTGTAEEVAERIAREARRRRYWPVVMQMNSADVPDLRGTFPFLQADEPASLSSDARSTMLEIFQEVPGHVSKSYACGEEGNLQLSLPAMALQNLKYGLQIEPSSLLQGELDCKETTSDQPMAGQSFDSLPSGVAKNVTASKIGVKGCQDNESDRIEEFENMNESIDACTLVESDAFFNKLCLRLPPLCVIYVAATTGQGDDPDNMKDFFARLWGQRRHRHLLKGIKFGVLALGDSSYQKFNYSGKRLNNLLQYLGATPLLNIGLADDQHDLGPDFIVDAWLAELWMKLATIYPLPDDVSPITQHALPPPRFRVEFLDDAPSGSDSDGVSVPPDDGENDGVSVPLGSVEGEFVACPLTKLERVTATDHFQDVRLVEFDVSSINYRHKPGDVLYIRPENLPTHVKEFLSVTGFEGSRRFRLQPTDENANIKEMPPWLLRGCSVEQCVTKYLDIMSVPKRYFFELLSFFTTDELEKEKFLEFSSAAGQQDMYDYCNRPKRSIVEVLADFRHTNKNIPFEYLFDVVPRLKPRAYSIASSSAMLPKKAQVLIAVVNYRTILKRPRLGVCSNWITTLSLGHPVFVSVKKGSLKFPLPNLEVVVTSRGEERTSSTSPHPQASMSSQTQLPPVIMIAPGTGVAPFRSYIQECVALGLNSRMLLFFGCRSKSKDFFFEEEWRRYRDVLEIYTAFSRDQEDKIYVQHRIRDDAQRLWTLINEDKAQVFFAGNAKRVPIDVSEALTDVCMYGLCDQKLADAYMKNELGKRYQTETWA
ncbi:NADPH-dependent diflavin oxidoreductase 1 [Trinorchestia longiramus]|nr:NADPH-dependent diflavin oxidoreductase 1 [Trinorchestia longiramus]